MNPWLIVLGAPALLLVLGWAHRAFWVRRYRLDVEYAEHTRLEVGDGASVELRRLSAPPMPELPPVLLVHGLAANHRNLDVQPDLSLARHLHARGRDVWLLTLRSGRSDRPRSERSLVRFAAMVHHDLPVAVAHLRARTGSEVVDYVGFSMGGMLLYAALGRSLPASRLRRVVLIGAPGRFAIPWRWLRVFGWLPRWAVPTLHLRLAARMGAFLSDALRCPFERLVFNRANVARGAVGRALVNLIEDVPGPLQADFGGWALGDGVLRVDGEPVLPALAELALPALFCAGAADHIAPPACVRAAFDAWGAGRADVHKEWRLLGRCTGARADYGHGDLAIGRDLPADLFEPVADFLARS